jgi:hypothetical protein
VPKSLDTTGKAHYDHPAFQLCEQDMIRNQNLRGLPLCDEHKHFRNGNPIGRCKDCVGEVVDARVLKDNSVYVVASIDATPNGEAAAAKIRGGRQRQGFSMGFINFRNPSGSQVTGRSLREISITDAPHWPVCSIAVTASADENYKKDEASVSVEEVWIPIDMSSAPTTTAAAASEAPAAAAAPTSAPTTSAAAPATESALLQDAAALAKDAAERQARDAEIAQKLARLDEYDRLAAEKKAAEKEQLRKKAENWTSTFQKHAGEAFTPKHKEAWIEMSASEQPALRSQAELQEAIVTKLDMYEKAAAEAKQEAAKLQEELKKRDAEQKILEARMRDSRAHLRNGDATTAAAAVPVTANRGGEPPQSLASQMSDFFMHIPVATAKWEQRVVAEAHPNIELRDLADPSVPVTANAETVAPNGFVRVPNAPVHQFVESVQNGPRGVKDSNGFPTGAAMLSKFFQDWEHASNLPMSEKTRVNKEQGFTYKMEDGRLHTVGRVVEREIRL